MKSKDLIEIIKKLKEYKILEKFKTKEEINTWLKSLNDRQISNIKKLNIPKENILFSTKLLIDNNLLDCEDYIEKINALITIKNGEGFYSSFEAFILPKFLNSKHFYKDIEIISNGKNIGAALLAITNKTFIESPYHKEDLELIVNAKDIDGINDMIIASALEEVAANQQSIKSSYHKEDMQLIANTSSKNINLYGSYPKCEVNNLATNTTSLSDKYHLENMHILSRNNLAREFLYELMTDKDTIKGENYLKEIEYLDKAKTYANATALYYYIINPERRYDYTIINQCSTQYQDYNFFRSNKDNRSGRTNKDYLKDLELLSNLDENKVLLVESILSNKNSQNSKYKDYDIDIIQNAKPHNYSTLYNLLTNKVFASSDYHIEDLELIQKSTKGANTSLLIKLATNTYNVKTPTHSFDMNYVFSLDFDNITKEQEEEIIKYLFTNQETTIEEHKEILEKLKNNNLIINKEENNILEYIEYLLNEANTKEDIYFNPPSKELPTIKKKVKIKNIFNTK